MTAFKSMQYKVYETIKLNDGTLDQDMFRCQTYEEAMEWIENRYHPSATYTIFDVVNNRIVYTEMGVDVCKKEGEKDEIPNDI